MAALDLQSMDCSFSILSGYSLARDLENSPQAWEPTLWGMQTENGSDPGRRTVSTPGPEGGEWREGWSGWRGEDTSMSLVSCHLFHVTCFYHLFLSLQWEAIIITGSLLFLALTLISGTQCLYSKQLKKILEHNYARVQKTWGTKVQGFWGIPSTFTLSSKHILNCFMKNWQ